MKILVACEESQEVTKQLRLVGNEAYSCDVVPCSGGRPEWHLQQDVLPLLEEDWDMIIAFPPCTHIATSGARWFPEKIRDGRQQKGIDFFLAFTDLKCPLVAIENPVGIMSSRWRKPDQIIQPWMFGDPFEKRTCLWLKGLPPLEPDKIAKPEVRQKMKTGGRSMPPWYSNAPKKDRARIRSRTFPGVARAMAEQWGL